MKNVLHEKAAVTKKANKLNFKKIVHLYDNEEIMESFSEHQMKKKIEVFRKKNMIRK